MHLQVEKIIPKAGQPEYKFFLFTHIDFEVKYNGDRVIEVNVLTDPNQAVDISENTKDVKVGGRGSCVWMRVCCVRCFGF
jgi:hypothetical protein